MLRLLSSLSVAGLLSVLAQPGFALPLQPTLAGAWAAGTGARAEFRAIDGNSQVSSGYWKEDPENGTGTYSPISLPGYAPISSFDWGTGLWGLGDWQSVQSGEIESIATWSGIVARIDQANGKYRSVYGDSWGPVSSLSDVFRVEEDWTEENWTARYTGYLRITEAGEYNFGVLADDGFFLRICGVGEDCLEISADFLAPRNRFGFDENLLLTEGLYRFELGAYNRLEAGVVQLAWWHGGNTEYEVVPTEHLVVDPTRIPLPGSLALIALGGIGIGASRRRSHR